MNELDSPLEFSALPVERQNLLLDWIHVNLLPIKSFNTKRTSYGLKQWIRLGDGDNSYFTNGQFKGAMLAAGYQIKNRDTQNWIFNVSERSPIILLKKNPTLHG